MIKSTASNKTNSLSLFFTKNHWSEGMSEVDVIVTYAMLGKLADLEKEVKDLKLEIETKKLVKKVKLVAEEGYMEDCEEEPDEPKMARKTSNYNMDKRCDSAYTPSPKFKQSLKEHDESQ